MCCRQGSSECDSPAEPDMKHFRFPSPFSATSRVRARRAGVLPCLSLKSSENIEGTSCVCVCFFLRDENHLCSCCCCCCGRGAVTRHSWRHVSDRLFAKGCRAERTVRCQKQTLPSCSYDIIGTGVLVSSLKRLWLEAFTF